MSRPSAAPSRILPVAFAVLGTVAILQAHGGQYRGPSNVPPPSNGSSSGSSGSSGGGSIRGPGDVTPSDSGRTGGGSSSSSSNTPPSQPNGTGANAPAGRSLPRGISLEADAAGWETWWEFQKDPRVRARDSFRGARRALPFDAMLGRRGQSAADFEPPTGADVRGRALPALIAALETAIDRDTVTGCMVAMAKIGLDLPGQALHDQFRARLRSKDQEIRETAALCFGIARQCEPRDLDLLCALLLDDAAGRAACDRATVDERTRSFAAYALGLCLEQAKAAQATTIHAALLRVLGDQSTQRNLTVAVVAALAQARSGAFDPQQLGPVVDGLEAFYRRDLGPGDQLLQAHVPLAIAHLLGREDARADRFRGLFRAELAASLETKRAENGRTNLHLHQSCALALGELARPWNDANSPDAAIAELLLRVYREHKDQQTRYFAVLALGRQGGELARAALLRELDAANRSLEKPWVAIALASLVHSRWRDTQNTGANFDPDQEVGRALVAVLEDVKNPSALGGTAVAIGMCRVPNAGDRLRDLLHTYEARDEVVGQFAIALALLGEQRAATDLRALLQKSLRRPQVMVQVATALGCLGDGSVVQELTGMLGDLDGGLARLSAIAMAVGQIGDRRCLDPLLTMLADQHLTPLTRAFAAVAIGGVCDRDPLPWNARFAYSLNYRAAVETLTDGAAGILDIL
jgi:hypothetical protein